jgi:hypothetical protein
LSDRREWPLWNKELANAGHRRCPTGGSTHRCAPDWEKEPGTGNGAFYMILVVLTVTLGHHLAGFLGKAGQDSWDTFRAPLVGEARSPKLLLSKPS